MTSADKCVAVLLEDGATGLFGIGAVTAHGAVEFIKLSRDTFGTQAHGKLD